MPVCLALSVGACQEVLPTFEAWFAGAVTWLSRGLSVSACMTRERRTPVGQAARRPARTLVSLDLTGRDAPRLPFGGQAASHAGHAQVAREPTALFLLAPFLPSFFLLHFLLSSATALNLADPPTSSIVKAPLQPEMWETQLSLSHSLPLLPVVVFWRERELWSVGRRHTARKPQATIDSILHTEMPDRPNNSTN